MQFMMLGKPARSFINKDYPHGRQLFFTHFLPKGNLVVLGKHEVVIYDHRLQGAFPYICENGGIGFLLEEEIAQNLATATPSPPKAILKDERGLTQLLCCPRCRYLVLQDDIVWKRRPSRMEDDGEVECCKFCSL